MGRLVYHAPQRTLVELCQAMEAACLVHPRLWTECRSDWSAWSVRALRRPWSDVCGS